MSWVAELNATNQKMASVKEMRGRNGECDTCQSGAYQHLHSDYPPSFGFQQVDERTPKRFDYPRQIKPTGI